MNPKLPLPKLQWSPLSRREFIKGCMLGALSLPGVAAASTPSPTTDLPTVDRFPPSQVQAQETDLASKYLVMVCHLETWWVWWRPWEVWKRHLRWRGFDEVMAGLLQACDMGTSTTKRPRITACVTWDALQDKTAFLTKLRASGHEIGIHTHLPGSQKRGHRYSGKFAYCVDDSGLLNQDLVARTLRASVIRAGLGVPQVHVSGMFTLRDTTACVLEEAGFTVDCSLLPGELGGCEETGDFTLCDNRDRTSPAAYRLSRTNHCREGESRVIELPCWGNLAETDDRTRILRIAKESLDTGSPMADLWEADHYARGVLAGIPGNGRHVHGKPEIVQMYFHYWDFIDGQGNVQTELLTSLGQFLQDWQQLPGCGFATASQAAKLWSDAAKKEDGSIAG